MKYIYLTLAIIGGGFTYYHLFLGILENHGNFDVFDFIKSTWIEDNYAKSITLDFWTGAIAGTIFIMIEGKRLSIKYYWIYIVLTFLIAFAFAFPLFLYVRELKIKK